MIPPRRHLPPLPGLLALEAVDRLGTATAAARALNLTPGAISRALKEVETQLGLPLLIRDRQRLTPTPAARAYVAEVRLALDRLGQAAQRLRTDETGGALTLGILPAFGMHWLAPRLRDFRARHPQVSLALSTRLRPFDLAAEGFDAAIHYGRPDTIHLDWPDTDHLLLMEEEVQPLCAPALLPAPLRRAQDVLSYPLLRIESRTGDWARWLAAQGVTPPEGRGRGTTARAGADRSSADGRGADGRPPAAPGAADDDGPARTAAAAAAQPGGMIFDQFATMQQAAIHGLGLALLPTFLIADDLADRRLVPAFGPPVRAAGSYWLVWPRTRPPRPAFTAFRNWIAALA